MKLLFRYLYLITKSFDLRRGEGFIDKSIDEDKQPILVFGANWCPDCRIFSGTIEIPKVKNYIDEHFNLLYIDVMR